MSVGKRRLGFATAVLVLPLAGVLLLTLSPGARVRAAFPGRNGKIAFTGGRQYRRHIYVIDADGDHRRGLTRGSRHHEDGEPAFSANGNKIAFARSHLRGGCCSIELMRATGGHQRSLTSGGLNDDPAFSPNGKRIAFTHGSASSIKENIYVMRSDGSHGRRLTSNTSAPGGSTNPAYAPNGKRIAFQRGTLSHGPDIWVMHTDGSHERRLTHTRHAADPSYSPDGRKIAFDRSGGGICVMHANGSRPHCLTKRHDSYPAFSPSGNRIAFVRGDKVWIMHADGSHPNRLIDGAAPDWGVHR